MEVAQNALAALSKWQPSREDPIRESGQPLIPDP